MQRLLLRQLVWIITSWLLAVWLSSSSSRILLAPCLASENTWRIKASSKQQAKQLSGNLLAFNPDGSQVRRGCVPELVS